MKNNIHKNQPKLFTQLIANGFHKQEVDKFNVDIPDLVKCLVNKYEITEIMYRDVHKTWFLFSPIKNDKLAEYDMSSSVRLCSESNLYYIAMYVEENNAQE